MEAQALLVKRHRVCREGEVEAPYEKLPRAPSIWKAQAKKESQLPVILPTGETIVLKDEEKKKSKKLVSDVKLCGKHSLMKTKGEDELDEKELVLRVDSSDEEEAIMSKTQLRRLEVLRKEMEVAERQRKERKEEKVLASKGKEVQQQAEVQKILKSLKTRAQKLVAIAEASQKIIAQPEIDLYRLDILFALARERQVLRHGKKQWLSASERHERNCQISTVAFLSIGAVMQNIIPGYKLRSDSSQHEEDQLKKLSKAVESLQRHEADLLLYYKCYVNMLESCSEADMDLVIPIVTQLLHASPTFNESDRLLQLCVKMACLTLPNTQDSGERFAIARVADSAAECLLSLMQSDASLEVAVRVARHVGKLAKTTVQHHAEFRGTVKLSSRSSEGAVARMRGKLLSILARINFEEKEILVKREARLRGLSGEQHANTDVYKDLVSSSIYGDIKTFEKNKNEILKELFVVFLRILRSPEKFPRDALEGSLEALGRLGNLVNVTLVEEMSSEIRRLVLEDAARLSPQEMLHAVASVVRMSNDAAGVQLKVDTSWISDALCTAILAAVPYLVSEGAAPDILPLEPRFKRKIPSVADTSPWDKELNPSDSCSILKEFMDVLDFLLKSSCVTGIGTALVSAPKPLVEIVERLMIISLHLADPLCRVTLLDLVAKLMMKYPVLQSMMSLDGVIVQSTGAEKSLYWANSLLESWGNPHYDTKRLYTKLKTFTAE